jgi:hypothetical protein
MTDKRTTDYTPTVEEQYAQGEGDSIDTIERRQDRKRSRKSKPDKSKR